MRINAIYALLDKSALIRREHLEAAIALWEYCEQSARWIFGSTTGDRNADKIMEFLRRAGNAGMTTTEISAQVFKRNLESSVLRDALRLLEQSGYVTSTKEITGGAFGERWFAGHKGTNLTN